MGGCSVISCHNRFIRGTKHFFRFPNDWRKTVWLNFTQRAGYIPKNSSVICEDHFKSDCFQKKNKRVWLKKNAIPTLIYKQTSAGLEKFEIKFIEATKSYDENDFMLVNTIKCEKEDKNSILKRKQGKIDELKMLCRFCLCNDTKTNSKLVQISNLESYWIDINELLNTLGLSIESQEIFSDVVCEQCFHLIVEFDNFKKKCREVQKEAIEEIQAFDDKILDAVSSKGYKEDEIMDTSEEYIMDEDNYSQPLDSMEIVEEHLVDDQEEYIEQEFELVDNVPLDQIEYIEEIPFSDEQLKNEEVIDQEIILSVTTVEQEKQLETSLERRERSKEDVIQGVDEYDDVSVDDIIKNPERNRFCFKIFECFFCKMKFAGKKTYVAHKCPVSEVKCEKCDRTFSKIHLLNSHIKNFHHELPISQHYCPVCKTVIPTTLNQFKIHRRVCNKQSNNQSIECEICHKLCNNLKGYTIHKLFHDTRNYTTSTGEKIAKSGLNVFPGSAVCELCGKEFQSMVGYRMHKRNVHRIGSEGEIFQCHVCSKICPTRRSLFDHMRNTHRVQETPCHICHKVFRTKILLSKHLIYHDETKRVYKCNLCPDKNGFFTKVALKRHQNSHLGKKDYHCTECSSSFTTNHQLKVHKQNKHGIKPETT